MNGNLTSKLYFKSRTKQLINSIFIGMKPTPSRLTNSVAKAKMLLLAFLLSASISHVKAQSETLSSGAYIINMGITPQTINNGLKPYGLIYELVKDFGVHIKWVINDSKGMDGIDFTYNGINYRGGPFIIPAEYRTATVNNIISTWNGMGVVGTTTTSSITVPVSQTIRVMPRWTMDADNGAIAIGYLENAEIPTSSFNEKNPIDLDCCDDLFVMPHADPEWDTHGRLFSWNGAAETMINGETGCQGSIWLACHAGSAFMDMFNPDNKDQQTNFLVSKSGTATGGGPYEENALLLWDNHEDGTLPYSYAFASDPNMQFMGTIDAATQNGSEQIYIPIPGQNWNPNAKVAVWDADNTEGSASRKASIVVSGKSFDDLLRGRTMLEAAHDHDKNRKPSNIAAQRIFFNFSIFTANEKAVFPNVGSVPDQFVSGVGTPVSFTLPAGNNPLDYTITWLSNCGGSFSPTNTQNSTFTPPGNPTNCIISVEIVDACGRIVLENKSIEVVCDFTTTDTPTSPLCNGDSNGSIDIGTVGGLAPFSYDYGTGSGTGTNIPNLAAGTYNVTLTDAGNCISTFTTTLVNPPLLTVSSTKTDVLCSGQATGAINLTPSGGTPPYTYLWNDAVTTKNRSNIPAATYTVVVTDANNCIANSSVTITENPGMSLSVNISDVNCIGEVSGEIDLTVTGAQGVPTFNWSNGATSEDLTSIGDGSYTVTVTDASGCTIAGTYVVAEPATALSATATMTNVSCNGGSNGSIDLTPAGGTPNYTFSWSNLATTQNISGLAAGTYTVTVTDDNDCTFSLTKEITQPTQLSLSTSVTDATCPGDIDGVIDLSVSGGTPIYTYDWSNDGLEMPDDDPQDLIIGPGTYSVIVTDANGCTATASATIAATNANPVAPISIGN